MLHPADRPPDRPSCRGQILVLLAVMASGCAGPDCEALAEIDPVVELGIGRDAFQPLETGDEVPWEFGMQGGQHVWGALRTRGLHGGRQQQLGINFRPLIDFFLTVDGEPCSAFTTGPRYLPARPDGYLELEGALVVLRGDCASHETEAILGVLVEDVCGRSAEDEREVLLVSP